MSDDRLVIFASQLLDGLVDGLTTKGIDLPEHRYVHSGDFAADLTPDHCGEALIVAFSGFVEGRSANGVFPGTTIKCAVPLVARFTAVLLRCVPSLQEDVFPSAADLNDSGMSLLTEAMEIANVVIDLYLSDTCQLKFIGSVVPFGPMGQIGGNMIDVYVELA